MEGTTGTEKIKCPYCGRNNFPESEICWACYKNIHIPKEAKTESGITRDLKQTAGTTDAETAPAGSANPGLAFWGRIALICGLSAFYLQWLKHDKYSPFLDLVNLAFHEAGHIFLGFFGEFIMTLGGTLFQLIIPAVCAVHFLRRENKLGWQLCLFWIGENFLNISIYAGDAIKQELPLVGGGVHDWTYLLTKMDLIAHTEGTARFIFCIGSVIIFSSIYLITSDAFRQRSPDTKQP